MVHKSIGASVLLLMLLVPRPASADDKLDLRLRLKKGDVHRMRVTLDQSIDQTVQKATQQTRQTIVLGYTLAVDDVDGQGLATISVRYDTASFHAKTPAGAVDYDSSSPPAQVPTMAAGLAALVGQGYSMKLTPEGRVIEVSGLEKLLASILGKLSMPAGPARAAAENSLRRQLNADNLKANLQNVFSPFPDHPVTIGDTWARDAQISLGFPLLIESGYKLKAREGGIATIELLGKASTAPNAVMDLGQGMRMSYQLKGEQHGSIQVEESTGWTRSAQSSQKLAGSATIETPGAPPQPVPVTVESETKTESQ